MIEEPTLFVNTEFVYTLPVYDDYIIDLDAVSTPREAAALSQITAVAVAWRGWPVFPWRDMARSLRVEHLFIPKPPDAKDRLVFQEARKP